MYWRFRLTCPHPPDIARQRLRAQTLAPLGMRDSLRQAPDPFAPRIAAFVGEVDAIGFDIQQRRARLHRMPPRITGMFRINGLTTEVAVEIGMEPLCAAPLVVLLTAACAISLQMIFDERSETLLQILGPITMTIAFSTLVVLDFAFDVRAIRRELCAILDCTTSDSIPRAQNTDR